VVDAGVINRIPSVIVYGVVSAETEKVVEFFRDRDSAEGVRR